MKKFCAVLCAFVLVIVLGLPVAAEGINGSAADIAPDIMAPAAYVVNLDTNIVVYEKNSETPAAGRQPDQDDDYPAAAGELPGPAGHPAP